MTRKYISPFKPKRFLKFKPQHFEIYRLIGNIDCKYKVGIKSLFSSKFYNIEYEINQDGSTESAYQNIKLLLGYK